MKMRLLLGMRTLTVAVCCVLLAGCVERSTVIKVKRDRSGIVHLRHHEQEVSISFAIKTEKVDDESESPLPSVEEIEEMAEALGNVELVSAEESINRNGWTGYDLIFRFDDVNELVLPDRFAGLNESGDDVESSDAASGGQLATIKKNGSDETGEVEQLGGYRFEMVGGVLIVHTFIEEGEEDESEEEPTFGVVDPFADAPPAPEARVDLQSVAIEQMMAPALSDMRIGVFVQVDGELEASNAAFREGNLITLLRLNVGDVLKDPDAKRHMKSMCHLKGSDRCAKMQEVAAEVAGLDIDLQDRIPVEYK